ncbi:hypothetical protein [Shewanella sp. S1-58-MNA-CIBAN-0166]|uniref:hypothetical protein n=1 Tax=Shewanella sp. S1-58-MNA-CIBAN-0166 TaxID=3140467 RepID=UPI00332D1FCC
MTMKSPEILLKELNNALRRLRGACADLGNEEIDEKLLAVIRRLLLAEVLGNTWILAVGGSQGAGKTTLMASLYNCALWLQSNEGRGEKMPVLIIEQNDITEPQGYVRRLVANESNRGFKLDDIKVDSVEFQRAICDPNAEDLLPVLQVPRRYFKRENQAWLLLPGYEKQDRANRAWQELMRQAMIAAGGCIVVTDETRMANQQQLEIVRDMLENELKHCKPYIVISKTETHRHDPVRLAELKNSAQVTFQIEPEFADNNIILTGTDDPDYISEWMPHLHSAIDALNFTGQSERYSQMSHLSDVIGQDLNRVMNSIRSKSRLYFSNNDESDGAQVLENILDGFDEAAEVLRIQHNEYVAKLASEAHTRATTELDNRLKNDHEGFSNWLSDAFDTNTETKLKMQMLVRRAWSEATPTFFMDYSNSLSSLTLGKLGPLAESDTTDDTQRKLPIEKSKKLIQMGYVHESGQPVRFSELNIEKVNDIKILLGNGSNEEHKLQETSKELRASVGLIPAMSLEYSRLFYAMPEVTGLKQGFTSNDDPFSINIVEDGVESLKKGSELGKTAIKSVATVMAVDVLSDGDSDILGAILGSTQPIDGIPTSPTPVPVMAHPAVIAATAVVAAAYLTTLAVTRLRTFEKKASSQAHSMLANVHDHHVEHLRKNFDKTMSAARERIKEKIRERYHMDEALMRKDRLIKAITDVTSITSDLKYELDSSICGLQLLIADRAV